MKVIIWNKKALEFIRALESKTKREIGAILLRLQFGEKLGQPQSKPMKIIDKHAFELRIKDSIGNHRVIYVLSYENKILIPHAFTKKVQKTPKHEIEISKLRLKELLK